MALGDNTAFFNETTFLLGDEQTGTTGISGIAVTAVGGGAIDAPAAKVLFTEKPALEGEAGPYIRLFVDPERDLQFQVKVMARYLDEDIAVITSDRLAIQGTFKEGGGVGSEGMTLSAKGFNSVGPTLRRLYTLGYV
tara:strand:+ start:129 stop:539 length:411 start_codon:yes stop_codon:yes gene_type:complete